MNRKKVALLTTVFPMEDSHLDDFFLSLSKQTYKDFDVVVLNDGYGSLEGFKTKYPDLNIVELLYSSTIAKNREYTINFVKRNSYDVAVFGDSDDYFDLSRIEKTIELLCENDIVVNDITLFGGCCDVSDSKSYLSHRVKNNSHVDIEFIKDKNIFGMSNTAINLSILDEVEFDSGLIAVDWFLFSVLLLDKSNKAVFTSDTQTFYRQYDDNTVGMKVLTEESYRLGLKVKEKHYSALSDYSDCYISLMDDVKSMAEVAIDKEFIDQLNAENCHPVWWENIKII